MVASRPRSLAAAALMILVLGALVPPLSGQSANALCDDPDDGVESSAVAKGYDDLVVDLKNVRFTPSSGSVAAAERSGLHYLTPSTGTFAFDIDVTNQGSGTADPTGKVAVRVSLGQPNGQGIVRSAEVEIPARGANASVPFSLDLTQVGRYTLQLQVNPNQSFTEECDDGTNPNPACPGENGLPAPCHFTYYSNNAIGYGILSAARPDLVVTQITLDGPTRATATEHADSEVTVRATLQNIGTVPAYNLAGLSPGAVPFQVSFAITGCACTTSLVDVKQVAANESVTVEAAMKVHGLAGSIEAKVVADPATANATRGLVLESSEQNNAASETFSIPTPDLSVDVSVDLESSDGRFVIPKGHPLEFVVNVQNTGDARAAKTNGDSFRVFASRDSPANVVLSERTTLDAHSSVSYRVIQGPANLTGNHDYTIVVDDQKDVLESVEANNEYILRVTVAVFEADLKVTQADAKPTVPPGVAGRVPFELTNKGTVTDTYTLSAPAADQSRVTFVDASGDSLRDVQLRTGATFRGEMRYEIPKDAMKGDTFDTRVQARSAGSGNTTTQAVTFTIGDDTLAPTIALDDPESGFLSTNKVVLRVTDNVNVSRVETDISGSFTTVQPDDAGGSLYTIDVTGRPASFKLNVRATDKAGNTVTEGFDLVRDTTIPRIASTSFAPERGIVPGMKITAIVDARDENMDLVRVNIWQSRPDGIYEEDHDLVRTNTNFQLRDWVVPSRPGHYIFNFTALDRAGNQVHQAVLLPVQGLDIRVHASTASRPIVTPAAPEVGDLVRMTWRIENTSPLHETGPLVVALGVDKEGSEGDAQFVGKQTISLAPGEVRPVTFAWSAAEGWHFFTLIIDQTVRVAEENEVNNGHEIATDALFPGQAQFGPSSDAAATASLGERIVDYWFVPVLFVTTVVLFVIAITLGRRSPA